MKKALLIYWPKGGNVEHSARLIAEEFGDITVQTLKEVDPATLPDYDLLIVGSSTVGAENWEEAEDSNLWAPFFLKLKESGKDLSNTYLAQFGLGDQVLYPDHFVDGMGILKDDFDLFHPTYIGEWPSDDYDFTGSMSLERDVFVGLALDEDSQPELTEDRVKRWVAQIKKEAGF